MEGSKKTQEDTAQHYMVELRLFIPNFVADWLNVKAKEVFKKRNIYVRDLLIALWRRENGR